MEYKVTIKATVYKTLTVYADSKNEADELAHEFFSVSNDEYLEKYDEETIAIETA